MRHAAARTVLVISVLLIGAARLVAQDPVKVSPKAYIVKLDNDKARVLEYRSKPGEKEPMHSHPAQVIHYIKGGKVLHTMPDGSTKISQSKDGETVWREPITHAVENIGKTEMRALLIEWKQPKK